MSVPTSLMRSRTSLKTRQGGAALFVAMIMLILMLMLAVVGMRAVTLDARIAGNVLESQRLQETADGTLREGERVIQQHNLPLAQCADGATTPFPNKSTPCFISEARIDALGLSTTFANSAEASGFESPSGYWYPRYIATLCPKASSPTAALETATTGCTEFYEVNSQATFADSAKSCGPDALCLRSAVNLFIK